MKLFHKTNIQIVQISLICIGFFFSPEIPNEIGALDQLERLYVQYNALKGPIPMAVFNMSSLTILALFQNSLNSSLPNNLCQHLPSIQRLYLAYNQLNGPLPSKWSQCKQLLLLQLGNNRFSGNIPVSIGNLTQIKWIMLSQNNFTGTHA